MFFHGPEVAMHMHMLSTLFWLILLGALIVTIVRLLSRKHAIPFPFCHKGGIFPPQPPHMPHMPSAIEILQRRYACGEIDGTTFDQMRERIEASERPRS